MFKKVCLAAAVFGAMASAHAEQYTLINEGFDTTVVNGGTVLAPDRLGAADWRFINVNSPSGAVPGWTQGLESNFPAQAGAGESFLQARWAAGPDGGSLGSWLITSAFSTAFDTQVSFWARGGVDGNYADDLTYGLVDAAGDLASLLPVATITATLGEWSRYTFTIAGQGAGSSARFALGHVGAVDTSDIAAVDSLVVAQVPEPSSWALAGVSLLGLMAARRRRAAR